MVPRCVVVRGGRRRVLVATRSLCRVAAVLGVREMSDEEVDVVGRDDYKVMVSIQQQNGRRREAYLEMNRKE